MNKTLMFFWAANVLLTCSSAKAVLITDFGSSGFQPTYSEFTSNIQSSNQITLDGTEGNFLFGELSAPVNILGSTQTLTLTGIYTGSYNGQFVVELLDAEGDSLAYSGFYANFTPGLLSTVNLTFVSETGTFGGMVAMVGFTAGSSGGSAAVDLVASNLSAVPEPTSSLLALAAFFGIAANRRKR